MCGIAGVVTFRPDGEDRVRASVARMLDALGHRGPDGRGLWSTSTQTGGTVVLGHTRLAIIDLSEAANQPMVRGRTAITFNGEIYNYRRLRDQFGERDTRFTTNSDTEVLLAGYHRWGEALPSQLDGMFAFGIWDGDSSRLLLARDRFGIKPLYISATDERIVFASEIRALVASGLVRAELNRSALWHYLGYQTTPTPTTLLAGVRMLEPGQVMEVDADGRNRSRRYWDLLQAASTEAPPVSLAEATEGVAHRLREAVESHLVSDVPVGVFLSGGLDSGAIVSTLTDSGLRPSTFTVALEDDTLDESAAAACVASHFGTEHTEIRLKADHLLESLPEMLQAVDHPSGDAVNTYVVSKAVRACGLKVALSGLGGDEIFCGYPSFRRLSRLMGPAARLSMAPAGLRKAAASVVRAAGAGGVGSEKAAAVLESAGSLDEMWPITRQLFSERARIRMLRDPRPSPDAYQPMLAEAFAVAPGTGELARVSYAESRAYMHDVLLRDTDQMSMAHGLEVRVPLLDHRLAAYVVALPDEWKLQAGQSKPLLANSMRNPLPEAVSSAPKRGFTLPFDSWMRGPLRPFCERQLGEQGLDGRGLLKPREARQLWNRFLERAPGATWGRLWTLVALNAWLERRSL